MSESQLIEYKESWRDEYLKWICGFANAQGGVLYIGNLCTEHGIAKPEYTVHPNDIMMMFKSNEPVNEPVNDPINDPINLLDLIKENPALNYGEYGKILGVSEATIKRRITELKKQGKIVRVGANKVGHWKVV